MNFQQAIEAHVAWKMKLSHYIAKPDHSLNAATVSQDSNCELGRWLNGEGRKHAGTPEFAKLVADHAHFHAAAGDVIRKADSGQRVDDEVALGSKSEYASASNAVVSALMKLKMKIAA
jgi:hypothetical protein